MHRPALHGTVGGGHALRRDEPAEQPPFALAGVAEKEVAVKLVQLQQLQQARQLRRHFGRHGHIV